MPAYIVADVQVHDPAGYEEYRQGVLSAARKYGGRYLARGGRNLLLEGSPQPGRNVIIEFPTLDKLREFWDSPEYTPLRRIRERCASSRIFAVEGLEEPLT